MKVAFVTRRVVPEGGISLASFRLATALAELGHEAEVLYSEGEPPPDLAAVGRRISGGDDGEVPAGLLSRTLEAMDPAVVLVGSGRAGDLAAAAAVAPTAMHAHMHTGACADNARYWSRLRRPCAVRAGWHCAALRPLLGCTDLKRSLNPGYVATQKKILAELTGGGLGLVCVSSDQAELFAGHGVPAAKTVVLPNLGIRAPAAKLAALARATPRDWRDATAFVGRLSKAKGGQLLEPLSAALPARARLRIFGDGYLAPHLGTALPEGTLCGHVSQEAVTGVLMWARAAFFPSLWPEPGGIVGVDAQVMEVPLAAFDVGAARHWPAASRFPAGDVEAMAAWLAALPARGQPRDPELVAAAQREYWSRIAARAESALGEFAAAGRFAPATVAPAEELIA